MIFSSDPNIDAQTARLALRVTTNSTTLQADSVRLNQMRASGKQRWNRPTIASVLLLFSLAVVYLASTASAFAQQASGKMQIKEPVVIRSAGGKVDFPATLIPKIPSSLPILKLATQAPPIAFLTDTLSKIGIEKKAIQPLSKTPALAARGISEELTGVVQQDRVLAYWHPQTGEAEISPQLEELKTETFVAANNPHLAAATSLARTVFARNEILPRDATQYTLGAASPMVGATVQKGANGEVTQSVPALYLTYVPVHRQVQGYSV
ncbi:MAG: hypothetical protein ABSG25_07500, partial [Bryobacteraceae bacterium]